MARAVHAREQTEANLWQSEKMSSLGRLAVGLAHEINNPLANATMVLEMMRMEIPAGDDRGQHARLDVMERNIAKAMKIGQDLLNYSSPSPTAQALLHLHDILEESLSVMGTSLQRIRIEKRFFPDLPEMYGVANKLEQVFINLLQNAADVMPHGGQLLLITDLEADGIVVTFRDSGPGIVPSLRNKVLEPFFTTRVEHGGVGLGLSIVHEIVKQHGGTLHLDMAPEGGLAVTVRLPRGRAPNWAVSGEGA